MAQSEGRKPKSEVKNILMTFIEGIKGFDQRVPEGQKIQRDQNKLNQNNISS